MQNKGPGIVEVVVVDIVIGTVCSFPFNIICMLEFAFERESYQLIFQI